MDMLEITIIAGATLAGPVLAVQAQKWVERATERRRARRTVFHSLMANRATRLSDDFVRSLNLIDLEFSPKFLRKKRDRAVINAWRALFGEYMQGSQSEAEAEIVAWRQRVDDRLVTLLNTMSIALGYDFSEEELRRGIYYPKGRVDLENTQLAILQGLRQVLDGSKPLPMKLTDAPINPDATTLQKLLTEKMAKAYGEDGALRIRVLHEGDKVTL
jgi:hypothetical protein